MGEITVFECDVTGERFGAKNDVITVGVKRRSSRDPFRVHEYDVHVCDEAIEQSEARGLYGALERLAYVAVEHGEIVGLATRDRDGDRPVFRERGHPVLRHLEFALEFLEEEVIV